MKFQYYSYIVGVAQSRHSMADIDMDFTQVLLLCEAEYFCWVGILLLVFEGFAIKSNFSLLVLFTWFSFLLCRYRHFSRASAQIFKRVFALVYFFELILIGTPELDFFIFYFCLCLLLTIAIRNCLLFLSRSAELSFFSPFQCIFFWVQPLQFQLGSLFQAQVFQGVLKSTELCCTFVLLSVLLSVLTSVPISVPTKA